MQDLFLFKFLLFAKIESVTQKFLFEKNRIVSHFEVLLELGLKKTECNMIVLNLMELEFY